MAQTTSLSIARATDSERHQKKKMMRRDNDVAHMSYNNRIVDFKTYTDWCPRARNSHDALKKMQQQNATTPRPKLENTLPIKWLVSEQGKSLLLHHKRKKLDKIPWRTMEGSGGNSNNHHNRRNSFSISYVQSRTRTGRWVLDEHMKDELAALSDSVETETTVWMDRMAYYQGLAGKLWATQGLRPYAIRPVLGVYAGSRDRRRHQSRTITAGSVTGTINRAVALRAMNMDTAHRFARLLICGNCLDSIGVIESWTVPNAARDVIDHVPLGEVCRAWPLAERVTGIALHGFYLTQRSDLLTAYSLYCLGQVLMDENKYRYEDFSFIPTPHGISEQVWTTALGGVIKSFIGTKSTNNNHNNKDDDDDDDDESISSWVARSVIASTGRDRPEEGSLYSSGYSEIRELFLITDVYDPCDKAAMGLYQMYGFHHPMTLAQKLQALRTIRQDPGEHARTSRLTSYRTGPHTVPGDSMQLCVQSPILSNSLLDIWVQKHGEVVDKKEPLATASNRDWCCTAILHLNQNRQVVVKEPQKHAKQFSHTPSFMGALGIHEWSTLTYIYVLQRFGETDGVNGVDACLATGDASSAKNLLLRVCGTYGNGNDIMLELRRHMRFKSSSQGAQPSGDSSELLQWFVDHLISTSKTKRKLY